VELQEAWPTLQQLGFALFAISYDEVATLAAFADKHDITYPLLSDAGSVTIRSLGLVNEHVAEQAGVMSLSGTPCAANATSSHCSCSARSPTSCVVKSTVWLHQIMN
jgi:hypothetical protein